MIEIALGLWMPFFLVFVLVTAPIPIVHGIAAGSGLTALVATHYVWWEGLLTIYFGFMAGGWLGARIVRIGRPSRDS